MLAQRGWRVTLLEKEQHPRFHIGESLLPGNLPILETLGKTEKMSAFSTRFNDMGFWAVLAAGITPFPYKVITIMSGWTGMPLGTFIATSILARGLRFFIVAALLWKFGAPIRDFIERRLGLMFALFVLLLAGGFYLLKVIS